MGCAARVLKALKHSSGNYSLILQGLTRIRLVEGIIEAPYLRAKVQRLEAAPQEDVEAEALAMSLRDVAKQVIQLMPELPLSADTPRPMDAATTMAAAVTPTRTVRFRMFRGLNYTPRSCGKMSQVVVVLGETC